MEIIVADHSGFCYGVKRALAMVEKALAESKGPLYSLGPLIHNRQVVSGLEARGLKPVNDLAEADGGTLVIRSHGVEPQVLEAAKQAGLELIDATCTFVTRAQQEARRFVQEGYETFIVGESDHPEVKSIVAWAENKAKVFDPSQPPPTPESSRLALVAQTTQSLANLQAAINHLLPYAKELCIANTVCGATTSRQGAAAELARQVDVLVVVGGYHSANTRRLAQIGGAITRTYHVEVAEELKPEWFEGVQRVGVTAGASTPDEIIQAVVQRLREIAEQQSKSR